MAPIIRLVDRCNVGPGVVIYSRHDHGRCGRRRGLHDKLVDASRSTARDRELPCFKRLPACQTRSDDREKVSRDFCANKHRESATALEASTGASMVFSTAILATDMAGHDTSAR